MTEFRDIRTAQSHTRHRNPPGPELGGRQARSLGYNIFRPVQVLTLGGPQALLTGSHVTRNDLALPANLPLTWPAVD